MDLSIFRLMLFNDDYEDISIDLQIFNNRECCFYYDESNNIRKLWLAEYDFNAPVYSDFVLGGVMHFGANCNADIDKLKCKLALQKSTKEMKFKHLSKGKDFIECLSEPKVGLFLQWLAESDLYVHSYNINNLYWAVIDIVDTIAEPSYVLLNPQMKNELYKIARSNYADFYRLLVRYDYPNITPENIEPFYQGIIDFIENIDDVLPFETEFLRQGLKSARRQDSVALLQDNTEKTIIESYFPFYLRSIGLFPSAKHVFDNEYHIEEQFRKSSLTDDGEIVTNYCFVDSIDSPLVQVSDCIVGLFGKYYTYLNSTDLKGASKTLKSITPVQRNALKMFARIIRKSEDMSRLLLCSSESIDEHDIGSLILNHAIQW